MYPPTLPEIIHAYHGDLKKLNDNELIQYAFYIQSQFKPKDEDDYSLGLEIKDALTFNDWRDKTNNIHQLDLLGE